jgi:hypothetical protein
MKLRTTIDYIDELLAVSGKLIKSHEFQKVLIEQVRDLSYQIKGLHRLINNDLEMQIKKIDQAITHWTKYHFDLQDKKELLQ